MASPQPPAAEAVSLNTPDTPEDISRKRQGSPLTSTEASVIPSADTVVLPPTKIPRIEESHEQHGTTVASTTPTKQKKERKKKTRAALLFGYLGEGFAGLQINEGVRTVEGVLEPAIHRVGGISDDNAGSFFKVKWSRCARTDKGVSAACNVVSLKYAVLLKRINAELSGTSIRVYGVRNVTKSFDAKRRVNARAYEYVVQTFAFQDAPIPMPPARADGSPYHAYNVFCEETGEFVESLPDATTPQAATQAPEAWPSISSDLPILDYVRSILKMYQGTHNYHNFTTGRAGNDMSAQRYIMSFTLGQPFVGMLISFRVVGQSFMLLQIRKMVGFVLAMVRMKPLPTLEQAAEFFTRACNASERHGIPTAPALGLFLDFPIYDVYNETYGKGRGILSATEFQTEIDTFKTNEIYPAMVAGERSQHFLQYWLHMNDRLGKTPLLPVPAKPPTVSPPQPSQPPS